MSIWLPTSRGVEPLISVMLATTKAWLRALSSVAFLSQSI